MHGVHHLAKDIELDLLMRRITDAHRTRGLIAREPVGLPFGEPPLASDSVHDLHLIRAAGDRAQQPIAPFVGFLVIAAVHQRQQCQGRVAQPAEAVVPISFAADLLRQ